MAALRSNLDAALASYCGHIVSLVVNYQMCNNEQTYSENMSTMRDVGELER